MPSEIPEIIYQADYENGFIGKCDICGKDSIFYPEDWERDSKGYYKYYHQRLKCKNCGQYNYVNDGSEW